MRARTFLLLLALTWAGYQSAADEDAPAEPAPAADVVVEDVPADPLDAQAQQYEQMLQPKKWRELEFIRQTCDLTAEQRPKIKAAADASAKQAAKELLRNRQGAGQGDAGAYIRKDVFKVLEKTLTPEQMARYQEESVRRAAAMKKTTVRWTVARLDSYLYLNREQRDKIVEALTTNWKEGWEQWLGVSNYGGLYFPMIPEQHLVPHLNEQQKAVWQGAQKVDPGFWSGGGLRQQQADDDWWEGKAEADSKPAADPPKDAAKTE